MKSFAFPYNVWCLLNKFCQIARNNYVYSAMQNVQYSNLECRQTKASFNFETNPCPAPLPPSTDPKIPLLQSLGDQVANKCSHWQQVDSALREAFSQRLQPGCVAGWVHRDVHLTWRLLFCLLQSLCKWLGWVILNKHILSQVGPEVDQVLRHYVKQGSATILPWQLPLKSQVKVCTPAWKSFHWDTFVLLLSSFKTSFPL